uniref:SYMRK n=1 Tax=Arundo donax TaxID=35708 RepID=A0A0A9HUW3_ARUDO
MGVLKDVILVEDTTEFGQSHEHLRRAWRGHVTHLCSLYSVQSPSSDESTGQRRLLWEMLFGARRKLVLPVEFPLQSAISW